MAPINWYRVRHYLKWILAFVTVLFFLVTIVKLLTVKQLFIKRYVELHMEEENTSSYASFDGHHKVFQVDEEIDLSKVNLTESLHPNETMINLPVEHRHDFTLEPSLVGHSDSVGHSEQFTNEVKFITGIIVAAIIVVEMVYCVLYLYIIGQKRFGPMMCFAILSTLTFVFHVKFFLTIPLESDPQIVPHQSTNFYGHIDSLSAESLVNHITHSSLIEVLLSATETVLALVYTAVLYKFPGRQRSYHHRLAGFFRLTGGNAARGRPPVPIHNNGHPLPNGHATAIEMDSIDEQNNDDVNAANSDASSQSSTSSSPSLSERSPNVVGSGDSGGRQMASQSPTTPIRCTPTVDGSSPTTIG